MENLVNNVNSKNTQEMENSEKIRTKNGEKVFGVAFKAKLKGYNVCNYDNADMQKSFLNQHNIEHINIGKNNDNHKLAKRVFYCEIIDGKVVIKSYLKISAECIRYHLFGIGNNKFTQADWQKEKTALARFTNPLEYMHGYTACNAQKWSFYKTSSLTVTDAVDKKAIVVPEWCVNANEIKAKKDGDEKSTSIYIKDKTGETEYDLTAYYNPMYDQFICLDNDGKVGFPNDLCETESTDTPLALAFKDCHGRIPYKRGKYVLNNKFASRYQIGCMFDEIYINYLFKVLIERFQNFKIGNECKGCKIVDLQIALLPEGGIPESEYPWEDIKEFNRRSKDKLIDFHQYFREATVKEIDMIDVDGEIDKKISEESKQNNTKKSNSRKSNSTK